MWLARKRRNTYRILVRKTHVESSRRRPKRRRVNKIKIGLNINKLR